MWTPRGSPPRRILGADDHLNEVFFAGADYPAHLGWQLLEGRAVGEGEEEEDGVCFFLTGLWGGGKAAITRGSCACVSPPAPSPTHGQEMLEFFQGPVPAVPKMELEDDGAVAGPRLGRPEHRAGLYA